MQEYHQKTSARKAHKQQGAGFIEVLVALVILAIGLLGVMSLHVRGLSSNQQAVFVTEANMMAVDMAERIIAYGINSGNLVVGNVYDKLATDNCTNIDVDIVQDDCNAWSAFVGSSSLPSGRGAVAYTAATTTYTITVHWDNDRDGDNGTDCPNDSDDDLDCYQLTLNL